MKLADFIAVFALTVSCLAAWLSWYTFNKTDRLARDGFLRNYRPYIMASNFAYINKDDGKWYPKMNILMVKVLNAPALITNAKMGFYRRQDNKDSLIFQQPDTKDYLIYPVDGYQFTLTTEDAIMSPARAKNILPALLIRKVKIEYQWISDSTLQYEFEGEWKYDLEGQNWVSIYQNAN
jgi:hypothetical protein